MPSKEPLPLVGTEAQPAPKGWAIAELIDGVLIGALMDGAGAAGAADVIELLQAVSASDSERAAVTPASLTVRVVEDIGCSFPLVDGP